MNRITDRCKNITLPQLCLQAVINKKKEFLRNLLKINVVSTKVLCKTSQIDEFQYIYHSWDKLFNSIFFFAILLKNNGIIDREPLSNFIFTEIKIYIPRINVWYRLGTVNSNTVNLKFYLIRSY